MSRAARAKVFWSGGSQAVRLPKALRLDASEVTVRRVGRKLVIEAVAREPGWGEFWDELLPLGEPVERHCTLVAEKRKPL
jgi:virulence-associated protein VagC